MIDDKSAGAIPIDPVTNWEESPGMSDIPDSAKTAKLEAVPRLMIDPD